MQDVFILERTTKINPTDSYIISYPYFLSYFAQKTSYGVEDVVCGAHMVYGWMPTILDLYLDPTTPTLVEAADLLSEAKRCGNLTDNELERLATLINNSLVGTSKLLHFIAPEHFAIWDSRVYSFVYEERPYHERVNQVQKYRKYMEILTELQGDHRFPQFHSSMNKKIRYEVSPLRSLEIVMYLNAPKFRS
ncbi:MAG: hypothetical protein H8D23_34100 [Candidatus Brocadiales bacterium]|nr:hypothetical protein [Candidatus Brocadiales bacterium]